VNHTGPVRLIQQLKCRLICGFIVFKQLYHTKKPVFARCCQSGHILP
jgi:CHASE1-domain containing sensor protein